MRLAELKEQGALEELGQKVMDEGRQTWMAEE
jgi:hypothetical protein